MENINFKIDIRDRKISRQLKTMYYILGSLIVVSALSSILLNDRPSFNLLRKLNLISLFFGILFIIQAFTGRYFMAARKYISISDDSI
jgi:hypothetical protein